MRVAGVDGCKAGWICVVRAAAGALDSACYVTAEALLAQSPPLDALAIDVPIGLLERGARACDREARSVLGARRSSVFPAPPRALLAASSWEQACQMRERLEGKKISKQLWGIVPKIREVDAALRGKPGCRAWVHEVHPEVCFWALRGSPMAHSKKKVPGRNERLALVSRHFGDTAVSEVRRRYRSRDVADDDILDAFAALWTAERIVGGEALQLPSLPPQDAEGLRMEIVY